jgi:hypothetical protein
MQILGGLPVMTPARASFMTPSENISVWMPRYVLAGQPGEMASGCADAQLE